MTLAFCSCKRVEVPVMSAFDAQRYMGTWYEIARLDHRFERGLERVTANYRLRDDGKVEVINRGYDPVKQHWNEARAVAVQTPTANYLKVYFFPLIAGKYRVAYVDDAYTTVVVSGGSTNYLWFMARTPYITPDQLATMISVGRELGYDTDKLMLVNQE